MRSILSLILLFISIQTSAQTDVPSASQNSDTRFISDDLFIYLHAGPGRDFRLKGSIGAGSKVQLLQVDEDKGFAEIIDERERRGWVESKFVSRNPSIRAQLSVMQTAVNNKQADVEKMQAEVKAMKQNVSQSNRQKTTLNRQITEQLEQISSLNRQIEQRERMSNMQWFTRGSVLAIVSVVIGYLLGLFGRKSGTSKDRLM